MPQKTKSAALHTQSVRHTFRLDFLFVSCCVRDSRSRVSDVKLSHTGLCTADA